MPNFLRLRVIFRQNNNISKKDFLYTGIVNRVYKESFLMILLTQKFSCAKICVSLYKAMKVQSRYLWKRLFREKPSSAASGLSLIRTEFHTGASFLNGFYLYNSWNR